MTGHCVAVIATARFWLTWKQLRLLTFCQTEKQTPSPNGWKRIRVSRLSVVTELEPMRMVPSWSIRWATNAPARSPGREIAHALLPMSAHKTELDRSRPSGDETDTLP